MPLVFQNFLLPDSLGNFQAWSRCLFTQAIFKQTCSLSWMKQIIRILCDNLYYFHVSYSIAHFSGICFLRGKTQQVSIMNILTIETLYPSDLHLYICSYVLLMKLLEISNSFAKGRKLLQHDLCFSLGQLKAKTNKQKNHKKFLSLCCSGEQHKFIRIYS